MVKSLDEMKTVIGLDSLSNLNEVLLKDKTAEDELTVKDILETIPEYVKAIRILRTASDFILTVILLPLEKAEKMYRVFVME